MLILYTIYTTFIHKLYFYYPTIIEFNKVVVSSYSVVEWSHSIIENYTRNITENRPMVQWLEHLTSTQELLVAGSIPYTSSFFPLTVHFCSFHVEFFHVKLAITHPPGFEVAAKRGESMVNRRQMSGKKTVVK